jgi:photosystem II stability/assembly factor-like uncharacterized protein
MKAVLLFGMLCVVPNLTHAQWERLPDPPGNIALSFTQTDSGAIFSGTTNGVWVSFDQMSSWHPAGLQGSIISNVAAIPGSAGDRVFAASQSSLFESTDSGTSWAIVDSVFSGGMLTYNGAVIVWNLADTPSYISSTTDGGASWTVIAEAPPNPSWLTVAISHGIMFAAAPNSGLWSRPLGGNSWTRINYPGLNTPECMQVTDSTIVVGDKKIYLSTNLGKTWSVPANKGLDTLNQGFSLLAMKNGIILGYWPNGIVRSFDSGETWTDIDGTGGFPNTSCPYPGEDYGAYLGLVNNEIVVGEPMGIYRSVDGYSWKFASHGMTYPQVGDIVSLRDTLFAIMNGAVFHSTDDGESWDDTADFQSAYRFVTIRGMLFALSDNGLLWRWRNGKWESSKSRANYALAIVDSTLFGCTWNELLVSMDSGATWKQAWSGYEIDWLQYIYSFGDTLFGLPNEGQVGWPLYFSTDHGASWNFASTFPTEGGFFYMLGAQDSSDLLIYNYGMMNLSTDHGFHWRTIDHHFATFAKAWDDQIFVGLSDTDRAWSGLFKLSGTNLIPVLPDTATGTMQSFTADDNFAYVSTSSNGIWRTSSTNLQLEVSPSSDFFPQAMQLFPNPVSTESNISFSLPVREPISITLYDDLGIARSNIFRGVMNAGNHTIPFRAPELRNGIYEIVLTTPATRSAANFVIQR